MKAKLSMFVAGAALCLAAAPALYAAPAHFLLGSSLYNNLSGLLNQKVKLVLKGGGEIEGIVTGVGNTLVRLENPAGSESLVVIDEIAVLSVQVRK
jgi:hypothetical protein